MENEEKQTKEDLIVQMLKTVFDPEIPVNIYDLGLIYKIDLNGNDLEVDMTLTAPNCPAADFIAEDVKQKLESIDGIDNVKINLVFEPEWDRDMISEEGNNNKIQVYSYWHEDRNLINQYNDNLEGFLYSFTLYIKYYYSEYYDKLNYLLFKYPEIRNHINIFICKWEIFDKICNIVFGFFRLYYS